jgi:hypothetical protein
VPGPASPGHRRRHPALPAPNLDQISSRTVTYELLTLLLAGGYASIVRGLGQLLGRKSSLVVAAATLTVVAPFQPARGGFTRWSTRHFNHRRYDTARIIATFSTRLRDQVDLTTLTGELLAVVNQTVRPTRASLWPRPQGAAGATDGTAHRFLSRR